MHNKQSKDLKIGFMYNHETAHQVAHTAPILKKLLEIYPDYKIDVLTSTREQEMLVRRCLGLKLCQKTQFISLLEWDSESRFLRFASKLSPLKRLDTLKKNLGLFRTYDVLVVPEWTSLLLKDRFDLTDLKLIFTHHGAGDRSVTYNENIRRFDFVLLPGRKFEQAHIERELVREGDYAVVGYPKFDFFSGDGEVDAPLFNNDKPVVLYNPHFDPYLSSWYKMGEAVLDFFARSESYNLIFAPHIMLFERKLHTSLEHKSVRWRKNISEKYSNRTNMKIDLGSSYSIDMTYTRAADIYLGDVSSQIYEFMVKRRPCLFLNAHEAEWQNNPYYKHWTLGPVTDSIDDLDAKLKDAVHSFPAYASVQETAFENTFDLTKLSSSERAAQAIANYLTRLTYTKSRLEAAQ